MMNNKKKTDPVIEQLQKMQDTPIKTDPQELREYLKSLQVVELDHKIQLKPAKPLLDN